MAPPASLCSRRLCAPHLACPASSGRLVLNLAPPVPARVPPGPPCRTRCWCACRASHPWSSSVTLVSEGGHGKRGGTSRPAAPGCTPAAALWRRRRPSATCPGLATRPSLACRICEGRGRQRSCYARGHVSLCELLLLLELDGRMPEGWRCPARACCFQQQLHPADRRPPNWPNPAGCTRRHAPLLATCCCALLPPAAQEGLACLAARRGCSSSPACLALLLCPPLQSCSTSGPTATMA